MLVEIERTNARLGHENQGPLSPASGFLPTQPPLRSFSPQHAAWDRLAAELPQLYQDLQVRAAVDALPVLAAGPDDLPDRELPRAATVLGSLAHAYVHQSAGAGSRLPAGLGRPVD